MLLAFALLAVSRIFLPLPFVIEVVIFSIYTMGCSFLLGRVGFISFGQPAYLVSVRKRSSEEVRLSSKTLLGPAERIKTPLCEK